MKIHIRANPKFLKGLVFSMVPFLSGCFMMFLPTMPMIKDNSEMESDPDVSEAIIELIQRSVKDLADNRGRYDQILLGEVKVFDNLISVDKARMLLLKSLREKNELHIHTRDDLPPDAQKKVHFENSSAPMTVAVLNVQFYNSEGQILQAQQLVDMQSNTLLWSAIQSVSLSDPVLGYKTLDESSMSASGNRWNL